MISHIKLQRLCAADLRSLQSEMHIVLERTLREIEQMQIPDLRRLEVLGSRLAQAARALSSIDMEVVQRDLLESLPDATGPEELNRLMQHIQ